MKRYAAALLTASLAAPLATFAQQSDPFEKVGPEIARPIVSSIQSVQPGVMR